MADTYVVVRDMNIAAAPDVVMAHLTDFHRWQAWSPWEGLDPDQQRTYSGADSGVGAKYAWKGNRKVGEGTMAITAVDAPTRAVVAIQFIKPFAGTAETRFDIRAEGPGSSVTWTMEGDMTLMTRIMGIFKSMDSMIGPDIEKGLAQLKTAAEADASSA